MSLDVSLYGPANEVECECSCCGHKHTRNKRELLFDANITHNLSKMATEAGIYEALWAPEEKRFTKAAQLVEPLKAGIKLMHSDPQRFRNFDAKNRWGTYDQFVPWIERYLAACERYPDAEIHVSR